VHFYRLAGLSVQSEIAFPGAIVDDAPPGAADVVVRFGDVPRDIENPSAVGPNWAMSADLFLLRVPEIARFLVTRGRAIDAKIEDGATLGDATAFLTGTALGVLLHQRGHVLMHASAVSVDGGAVMFCGQSTAGKSTLAAALAQRGYPFVTDDVCAVSFDSEGRPMVHPDGRCLKLWSYAIDKLDLAESRGAPVRDRLEKFYVEPSAAASAPLPLRAVYVLRDARRRSEIVLERPNAVDAALILQHNAYRPQLIRRLGHDALYFRAAAAIADSAGVFILDRPLDFALLPEVIARLETHLRETGVERARE
jgi:hypothetical protein